ncbi:hypothetical protein SCRM01_131c [Synechococcus phage S-CRM01]|uniref:hypothetical protein n=1 Tax=Synechococcus phage S-CRM01 TaxID=1026955 RepID=UPI000209E3D4|nr:hypothetical protein SCRM01_131c [Synechococcus phage S-CRM01]AEC53077.1 hypothetical protein SCRM01_131c [Synechococcus phage S-CRM01]
MNFSEFLEAIEYPNYQIEGKTPKCKKGYRWDKNIGGCIPIGSKTKDTKVDETPPDIEGYNVIGSNGMDGGYALEDGERLKEAVYSVGRMAHTSKEEDEKNEKRLKKEKDRMMYGKTGQPPKEQLMKGQYKRFDKASGEWVLAQALPKRDKK